jgi:hypothetical protein
MTIIFSPRKAKTPFLITETAFCAEGGTRTRTGLLPHAPETCVSTSFTTSAWNSVGKDSNLVLDFTSVSRFEGRKSLKKLNFYSLIQRRNVDFAVSGFFQLQFEGNLRLVFAVDEEDFLHALGRLAREKFQHFVVVAVAGE